MTINKFADIERKTIQYIVMRKILDALIRIPRKRSLQFQHIGKARKAMLKWSRTEHIRLEHIEFVVPFVDNDFSLYAWVFYSMRSDIQTYVDDGTSERVKAKFKAILAELGYPSEWHALVEFSFACKEEVEQNYEGSYYNYVR